MLPNSTHVSLNTKSICCNKKSKYTLISNKKSKRKLKNFSSKHCKRKKIVRNSNLCQNITQKNILVPKIDQS